MDTDLYIKQNLLKLLTEGNVSLSVRINGEALFIGEQLTTNTVFADRNELEGVATMGQKLWENQAADRIIYADVY